ncbi:MAG: hypothetical protein ABIP35_11405 [Ginsengibacter sp.]
MQFNQIVAQVHVKNQLKELVNKNRLSHALLFLGKDGSGSLPLAIAFAQYILCEKINPKTKKEKISVLFESEEELKPTVFLEDSCGECSSCKKVDQLVHPDLHFSYPALKKDSKHDKVLSTDYILEWREFIQKSPYGNATDWINFLKESSSSKIENPVNKQANITSAECETILQKLSLKAFESDYKILIMWMPEYLRNEGNKLLKLIEEPPPYTIFILVTEDENAILPTILSRTQLVKIPLLENEDIREALIEKEIAPDRAAQITAIAEGNLREALLLVNNTEDDWLLQVREWLNVAYKNNVNDQLKWIEEVSRLGREKQKQLLKYFIHLLQQAIRVRYLPEDSLSAIPDLERDFASRLNNMCTLEAMEAIVKELDMAIYNIERNAHAKMLFHALTIRLRYIIKDNSLILVH